MFGIGSVTKGYKMHLRIEHRCPYHAFTLFEILVSISVIAVCIALLIPAVQRARESARRMQCTNNLRQLAIAMHNHESSLRYLPSGSIAKQFDDVPSTPWTFYRWSALASLSPYLENYAAYQKLNLNKPLYTASLGVTSENVEGAGTRVSIFLCPSDNFQRLHESFAPANYTFCTGSGLNGGTPLSTDGIFYVNSKTQVSAITDGTSNTIAVSESVLGSKDPGNRDPKYAYKYWLLAPLTENVCGLASSWNVQDPRGFAWVNGEYRAALYNHHRGPNSNLHDCIGSVLIGGPSIIYTPYGWKAARSLHGQGVNGTKADGSISYVSNDIDQVVWTAISTRSSGEVNAD